MTITGVVLLLAVGQPTGGTATPAPWRWWTAALVVGVLAIGLLRLAPSASPGGRAALLGMAAGTVAAFQAAAVKMVAHPLTLISIITSWALLVTVATAIIGQALEQRSLQTDRFAPAVASSNVATTVVSVLLGVGLYSERVSRGHFRFTFSMVGLAITVLGVLSLARATTVSDRRDAGAPEPRPQMAGVRAGGGARSLPLGEDF